MDFYKTMGTTPNSEPDFSIALNHEAIDVGLHMRSRIMQPDLILVNREMGILCVLFIPVPWLQKILRQR